VPSPIPGLRITRELAELDRPTIHRWLAEESYWAAGRSIAVIDRSLEASQCFGALEPSGTLVGLCRVVTDGATFAWLCDVFVAAEHRGRGIGHLLVGTALDDLEHQGVPRVLLATADAHGVYADLGFSPLATPERFMELDRRPEALRRGRLEP